MENNGVSGFYSVHACFLGCIENPEVSVKECKPDQGKENNVGSVPFLQTVRTFEHNISGAKQCRAKKLQWLCDQENEEIWQDRKCTHNPDQTDQKISSLDCTDLFMTEGDADGNVALNCHACQIQWGVMGGDDGDYQHDEA